MKPAPRFIITSYPAIAVGGTLSLALGCGLVAGLAAISLDAAQLADLDHGPGQTATQDVDGLRHAAARGDADAQYQLGDAYAHYRVESMEDAEAEAIRWYRSAAEQGHAKAQLQLGFRHERGWGVAQDYVKAHMWLDLAATRLSGDDRTDSVTARDHLAEKMTPAQITEAHRLAQEWKPATAR